MAIVTKKAELWCAWCGDTLPPKTSNIRFCKFECFQHYRQDVANRCEHCGKVVQKESRICRKCLDSEREKYRLKMVETVIALHKKGCSDDQISVRLGCSKETVGNYRRLGGIRMGASFYEKWSDSKLKSIMKMVAERNSFARVHKELGISRGQLIGRLYRHGFTLRNVKSGKFAT
jgi:hypothetical protein